MKTLRFLLGLTATVLMAQGPGRLGMGAAGAEARPALVQSRLCWRRAISR